MANSKGRRKLRRQRQEAGQGDLPKTTPPPPLLPRASPFWKKIPLALYAVLGVLALLITLLEGYPWLSVQKDEALDSHDPFSEMFLVRNGGYVPTTEMEVVCTPYFSTERFRMIGLGLGWRDTTINSLPHDGTATLPCFRISDWRKNGAVGMGDIKGRSRLDVEITYSFVHLPFRWLRRKQIFVFTTVLDENGLGHWTYDPNVPTFPHAIVKGN